MQTDKNFFLSCFKLVGLIGTTTFSIMTLNIPIGATVTLGRSFHAGCQLNYYVAFLLQTECQEN
jgi:hypothetical protein